ncbi:hypothetical protein UCMB321_1387 [Pseudomonas batumici]|uniref:Uncharacterized protein n=1 Tax=Pseudomonas batumici TaxID=226910 RepID=A0A0C2EG92_9PSED|nr:hypothetical protein UCMB321_1387 [Pseudomonas batumici]
MGQNVLCLNNERSYSLPTASVTSRSGTDMPMLVAYHGGGGCLDCPSHFELKTRDTA